MRAAVLRSCQWCRASLRPDADGAACKADDEAMAAGEAEVLAARRAVVVAVDDDDGRQRPPLPQNLDGAPTAKANMAWEAVRREGLGFVPATTPADLLRSTGVRSVPKPQIRGRELGWVLQE
jgi:hypothetical protein